MKSICSPPAAFCLLPTAYCLRPTAVVGGRQGRAGAECQGLGGTCARGGDPRLPNLLRSGRTLNDGKELETSFEIRSESRCAPPRARHERLGNRPWSDRRHRKALWRRSTA